MRTVDLRPGAGLSLRRAADLETGILLAKAEDTITDPKCGC